MIRFGIIFFCFLLFTKVTSQNIISNPSFEEYISCPNTTGEWFQLVDWFNPTSTTPNYFNSCCPNSDASVPYNFSSVNGYQESLNGNGYIQLICYYSLSNNIRDYLQQGLNKNLSAGKTYCGRFYTNLSNWSQYSINKVGMLLTDTSVYCSGACLLNFVPQIPSSFNVQLNDTLNWIELSGKFIANGTERFLTIGNFHANNNSNPILFNGTSVDEDAQYYFDNISLTLCRPPILGVDTMRINYGESVIIGDTAQDVADYFWSPAIGLSNPNSWQTQASPTENTTYTLQKITPCDTTFATKTIIVHKEYFNIYPNPSNGTLQYSYSLLKETKADVRVYDCIGRMVYNQELIQPVGIQTIDTKLAAGTYFVILQTGEKKLYVEKIVVTK